VFSGVASLFLFTLVAECYVRVSYIRVWFLLLLCFDLLVIFSFRRVV